MSLKVCTSAPSWSSWKLLVPLPPGPALQTDGEVFWWNTNSCNHWIRYRSEDESKGNIQALQPAGTGQREGPCPDGRAAILSAAAQPAADGSLPISDNADGNQERNRGYRANSMRKVGAQPISIQKIHIIYQPVREAIQLKSALALGGISDRKMADLPSCIQQNRSTTSKKPTQQHFHASGTLGWETLSSNPWPKGAARAKRLFLRSTDCDYPSQTGFNKQQHPRSPSLSSRYNTLVEVDKHKDWLLHEFFLMGTGCQPSVL